MVKLIERPTCPNGSISGTPMKRKKVPVIERLPCMISVENGAFTNNGKQGGTNKIRAYTNVDVPCDDYFNAIK